MFFASGGGATGGVSCALGLVPGGGLGRGDSNLEFGGEISDARFDREFGVFVEEMTDALKHFEFVDGAEFHTE